MANKSDQELAAVAAETRAVLRQERFAAAGSRPKNPNLKKEFRKIVARVLCEQRARIIRGGGKKA